MKKICGSWYADWRDPAGHRHRKAFRSAKAAAAYTARMKRKTQQGKARASEQ